MWINLCLAVSSAVAACLFWAGRGGVGGMAVGFAALSVWEFYCVVRRGSSPAPVILRLGGFSWTIEDFCRGWLITGETGSGKTLGAVNAMLWGVSTNCPTWGGVCVDDKGLYAETLSTMFGPLPQSDAAGRGEIQCPVILDVPACGGEQFIDLLAGFLFWGHYAGCRVVCNSNNLLVQL